MRYILRRILSLILTPNQAWDEIARSRESFLAWMERHVLGTATHAEFLRSVGAAE